MSTDSAGRQDLLSMLKESRKTLNEGTRIEKKRRWASQAGALPEVIAACNAATKTGLAIGSESLDQSSQAIAEARQALQGKTTGQRQSTANPEELQLVEEFEKQIDELEAQHAQVNRVIAEQAAQEATYNLTLFGRTMSGKSTLMEILTNGKGHTIGNGSQRTTKNVRTYHWQGLKITDVPGIAAFDGEIDEDKAYEAVQQADLVIFLITDDSVQDSEARHLARVRRTGRPVLGICNVKQNLKNRLAIRKFLRDHEQVFDEGNLYDLSAQFDAMTDQYTPGQELPLISTHLRARFLANAPGLQDLAPALTETSRFWEIEDHITNEVVTKGAFLRTKSLIDTATYTTIKTASTLAEYADAQTRAHQRLSDRARELKNWQVAYRKNANERLNNLINDAIGKLRRQIPSFAEEHVEDPELQEKWNALFRRSDPYRQLNATLKEVAEECSREQQAIFQDIDTEIKIFSAKFNAKEIDYEGIGDTGKLFRWGGMAICAALNAASAAALFIPLPGPNILIAIGLSIAGLIIGKVGRLFGNREKRRREAATKLRQQLSSNLDEAERNLRQVFRQWFKNEIEDKALKDTTTTITRLTSDTKRIAEVTRNLADQQQKVLLELNLRFTAEALRHIGRHDQFANIAMVARTPGQSITIAINKNDELDEDAVRELAELLGERVEITSASVNSN